VADSAYVEYSGLAWTDRLLPLSGNDLLSEDGFRYRMFHYNLTSKGQATTAPACGPNLQLIHRLVALG